MYEALLVVSFVVISPLMLARAAPVQLTRGALAVVRRLAGLQKRSVRVAGFNIVYLEGGAGEPLLLLHGVGADKDNFNLVAQKLRQHYRVIVPDLPGFGDSDKPHEARYGLAEQVARLAAFATAIGAERFHLGGNSMGGMVAGAIAVAHPERVLSLWLLTPAGVKSAKPSELMRKIDAGEHLPIFARNAAEMRALLAFSCHRAPYVPGFIIEALSRRQRKHYALNQKVVAQLLEGPSLDELIPPGFTLPTLIVWGERDRALDCSGADILHRLLINSRVSLLPNVGHVPMIEAPARVVADYVQFLRQSSIVAAPPRASTKVANIVVSDDDCPAHHPST